MCSKLVQQVHIQVSKLVAQGTADVIVAATAGTTEGAILSSQIILSLPQLTLFSTSAPTLDSAGGTLVLKLELQLAEHNQWQLFITDQILDGGTTVPAGAGYNLTLN